VLEIGVIFVKVFQNETEMGREGIGMVVLVNRRRGEGDLEVERKGIRKMG
jgi:hypothetical protein